MQQEVQLSDEQSRHALCTPFTAYLEERLHLLHVRDPVYLGICRKQQMLTPGNLRYAFACGGKKTYKALWSKSKHTPTSPHTATLQRYCERP